MTKYRMRKLNDANAVRKHIQNVKDAKCEN